MPPIPSEIFTYFNGEKEVKADPWPLYRALMRTTGGRPNDLANKIRGVKSDTTDLKTIMEANDAADALEAVIRELFGMKAFDPNTGGGAQWPHCFAVWEEFGFFMTALKKKTETQPTNIPPTESPPAASPVTSSGSA